MRHIGGALALLLLAAAVGCAAAATSHPRVEAAEHAAAPLVAPLAATTQSVATAAVTDARAAAPRLPILGWSSWNVLRFHINDTVIREIAQHMVASGLRDAGYNYILIDDGWPACLRHGADGSCLEPAPRHANGSIAVDLNKFPYGLTALSEYVATLGFRLGIYTAVSARTCGGYTGSLHHEAVDAAAFAAWKLAAVKYDTCNTDCSVHDQCLQNSTQAMRAALDPAMVLYVDSGNPTSPMRVFNPRLAHVSNPEAIRKLAVTPGELAWRWALPHADMVKSWLDIEDTFESTIDNLHNQIRVAEYQTPGHYLMPGMVTVGQGAQTLGEYRVQMFAWALLGAPLVLGADVRRLDPQAAALLTAPEVLAVAQDPEAVMGSLARADGACELWARPLADGSFAVAALNKGQQPASLVVDLSQDFFPAAFQAAAIRDLYTRRDLGSFNATFTLAVDPHDARIVKVTVLPGGLELTSSARDLA